MTKTEHEAKTMVELIGAILLGGVISLAICCVVLFLTATAISAGLLKETLIVQFSAAACAAGTSCGAFCAILRCKRRTLIVGLSVAVVFFLLLLTIGLLAYGELCFEQGSVVRACASLCGGGAAGLLCGQHKRKKRRN